VYVVRHGKGRDLNDPTEFDRSASQLHRKPVDRRRLGWRMLLLGDARIVISAHKVGMWPRERVHDLLPDFDREVADKLIECVDVDTGPKICTLFLRKRSDSHRFL
jgi:hypothetical protein